MLVSGFEVPPLSNIGEQVGRESRIFQSSVKVARRLVNPFGVGASPTLAAILWKAGRYIYSWLHLSRKQGP